MLHNDTEGSKTEPSVLYIGFLWDDVGIVPYKFVQQGTQCRSNPSVTPIRLTAPFTHGSLICLRFVDDACEEGQVILAADYEQEGAVQHKVHFFGIAGC